MKHLTFILLLTVIVACGGSRGGSNTPATEVATPETTPTESPQVDPLKNVELISPDNSTIKTRIAYKSADQTKGLQGIKESEFNENEGMLFFYLTEASRTFWMPNTYFNLDLIYLDEDMKIIDIVRNLPHYTGTVDSEIPRAPTIRSRHVLEMKAGSVISSRLNVGDSLQWKSSLSLPQTEERIKED